MQVLRSMQIRVQLPVIMKVDNMGAVYMTDNVTSRTKHIRSMYVREFAEDGVIKVQFVRTENNDSDILTKNLASALHARHSKKLVWKL